MRTPPRSSPLGQLCGRRSVVGARRLRRLIAGGLGDGHATKTPKYFTATVAVSPDADADQGRRSTPRSGPARPPRSRSPSRTRRHPQSLGSANAHDARRADRSRSAACTTGERDHSLRRQLQAAQPRRPGTSVSLTVRIHLHAERRSRLPVDGRGEAVERLQRHRQRLHIQRPRRRARRGRVRARSRSAAASRRTPSGETNITADPYLPGGRAGHGQGARRLGHRDRSPGGRPRHARPRQRTRAPATLHGDVTATPGAAASPGFATGGPAARASTTSASGYRLNAPASSTRHHRAAVPSRARSTSSTRASAAPAGQLHRHASATRQDRRVGAGRRRTRPATILII